MSKINRGNPTDAQSIIDEFIVDEAVKYGILSFLSNAIIFANSLNPQNWNLNLDTSGSFVRFNVGQVYCIEIFKGYVSILMLKDMLKGHIQKRLREEELDIKFKGYKGKKIIITADLEHVPDCLVKVPGSVGCHVNNKDVLRTLPYLQEANDLFISYAINHTRVRPIMANAHSSGFIAYLSQYCQRQIPNPAYVDEIEFPYNPKVDDQGSNNGGGFGDPETNRKVEQAAISFVTDNYEENGWTVKSVEAEKCGYDLFCTKGKLRHYVEVKGIQGNVPSFIITAGEVGQSQTNRDFVLYVVTSALTEPKLHKFMGQEFNEQFDLEVISYRASLKHS